MAAAGELVCVTGASGYIASFLVKELLEKGYKVRGTVRSLTDPAKTDHLRALPGAEEGLTLVEADLLDADCWADVVKDCVGVFHTASPFFLKDQTEDKLYPPAIDGTVNVLTACKASGSVTRVVLTSSMAAIGYQAASLTSEYVVTEADWSDEEFCQQYGLLYHISKIRAERAAWDFVEKGDCGFTLAVMNPCLVLGPLLQPTLNTSAGIVAGFLTGETKTVFNGQTWIIDVRDVAHAHVLAYENREFTGRVSLVESCIVFADLAREIAGLRPSRNVPTEVTVPEGQTAAVPKTVDTTKMREVLGLDKPIRWRSSLVDTIVSLEEKGLVPVEEE